MIDIVEPVGSLFLSRHPNKTPGVLHVDVDEIEDEDVPGELVVVFAGTPGMAVVVVTVKVVELLQPNQPGSAHDVVVYVVVWKCVVVVPSRQPHQPGVLQVDVRVAVFDVEVMLVRVVVLSEPLLSKYFQL